MSNTPTPTIDCAKHGRSKYALICQHLRNTDKLGYYLIESEPDEPAQAWCAQCDEIFNNEQGWNDTADNFANWQLYCETCHSKRLSNHTLLSMVIGTSPED